MSYDGSAWKWLLAAVLAAGVVALGRRALRQNRPLLADVRAHDSLTPAVLWNTLRIWSPLGLLVLAAWLAARETRQYGEQWLYRHTTLDEFCAVGAMDSGKVVPCTGFDGTLPADAVRPLGVSGDLAYALYRQYAAAQQQLLAQPEPQLRTLVEDPRAFAQAVSPFAVLSVTPPPAPDATLIRLFERRQALRNDPLRRTQRVIGGLLPALPITPDDSALKQIDAQIEAHLRKLHVGNETAAAKNRLRIALRDSVRAPADGSAAKDDEARRRAVARALADSQSAALGALLQATVASPVEAEAAYPLLHARKQCTLGGAGQNPGLFECGELEAAESKPLTSLGLRESIRRSITRWAEQAGFEAHARLLVLDREAAAGTLGAHEAAERATALVPASIDLGRQPCRPWRPGNCVMNQFAKALETALADARNQAVSQANQLAGRGIERSALGARAQIDAARVDVDREIGALHDSARAGLERVFGWLDLMSIVGWLVLGTVVLKSLLYVLALELFHKDSKLAIAFDPPTQAEGHFEHGPMVVIAKDFPHALITKKQMGNTNSALQLVAWPRVAPLVRVLRRKYFFFNRGTFLASGEVAGSPGMVATAESPLSVVAWHMQPGEEVVFDYRDFHGASENVSLHKELSLRLSTLLLGRWRFHYARCDGNSEGLLLLKARVQAVDQALVTAIPRARLVAWNRHLRFKADSQRHPWRSLVNDFTLVRSLEPGVPPGKWVTAPEQAELSTLGRLIAFVKSVVSAMF